jgi:hypothetical protein
VDIGSLCCSARTKARAASARTIRSLSDTLLSRPWSLFDVRDVEALCAQVVQRSGLTLSYHEREDLLAYLLAVAWETSTRFEPGRIRFSIFVTRTLRFRTVDWVRTYRGRSKWAFKDSTYERPRVQLVSLDAPDSNEHQLVDTLAGSGLDDDERRLSDELRALRKRSRRPGRRDDWLGDEAA